MKIDLHLVEACKANSRIAQKKLYLQLLPYLRAVCSRYLKDHSQTIDVLQEAFIKIFKTIENFDPAKGEFHKWSCKIVINEALKNNQRLQRYQTEEFSIDRHDIKTLPLVIEKLSDEHLLTILKQMPEDQYEVFNLYVIEGYQHPEIAAMLNISTAASRKKLSRARAWLRTTFGEKGLRSVLTSFTTFMLN